MCAWGEEFRQIASPARIGERQRALHEPEVPLNEPDHTAEVLTEIADKPWGVYADTTISGTRNPIWYPPWGGASIVGGSWSYQPPQSSQVMMIAVVLQYELPSGFVHGLCPTALTMDATHDGRQYF
jgi:hypothetical protein